MPHWGNLFLRCVSVCVRARERKSLNSERWLESVVHRFDRTPKSSYFYTIAIIIIIIISVIIIEK